MKKSQVSECARHVPGAAVMLGNGGREVGHSGALRLAQHDSGSPWKELEKNPLSLWPITLERDHC